MEEEAEFYQIAALTEALKRLRSSANRFVEIFERSDCNFIMLHAPDAILNHPDLPFSPSRDLNFFATNSGQRALWGEWLLRRL